MFNEILPLEMKMKLSQCSGMTFTKSNQKLNMLKLSKYAPFAENLKMTTVQENGYVPHADIPHGEITKH